TALQERTKAERPCQATAVLVVPWSQHRQTFCQAAASPEIYTLSLHDALPICVFRDEAEIAAQTHQTGVKPGDMRYKDTNNDGVLDRKSTRLNSSHVKISYAVFCLKKKTSRPRDPRARTKRARPTHAPGGLAGP